MKNHKVMDYIETLCIAVLSIILMTSISSNVYADGVFLSGFKSASKLTYSCESGSSTSIAEKATSLWNGVSSKVSITKYSGSDASIRSSITMSCNKYAPSTSDDLGKTFVYKAYGQNNVSKGYFSKTDSQQWVKAMCYQYKADDLSTTSKQATAAHEVGHALSLDHKDGFSIMSTGIKYKCKLYSYDKKMLKEKWGK